MCSKKNHAGILYFANSKGTRVFAISSLKSVDFAGISLLIIPQMPVGIELRFICIIKKNEKRKISENLI